MTGEVDMPDEATAPPEPGAPPALVLVGLPLGVSRQRRWTVLLRPLLLFPLLVVEVGYGFLGLVLVVAAWFSALFTKRVPDRIQEIQTGILRWVTGLYAYAFLLTDRWPGAHLAYRDGDAADVKIDHVELRRSAVFFRAILGVPVVIVQSVLTEGVWPFVVCMWVVALIRGRCPKTLHQAIALVQRFNARANAYLWLLTPTMPFVGTFGDGVEGTYVSAPPVGEAATGSTDIVHPAEGGETPTQLVGAPDNSLTLPATWVVRRRVKAVMVWMIVVGALTAAVPDALGALIVRSSQRNLVISTNNEAASAVQAFSSTAVACSTVVCVHHAADVALYGVSDAVVRLDEGWIGTQTTPFVIFRNSMIDERTTLLDMSIEPTTVASERTLYARLVTQSRAQYAAVTALLSTM